MKLILRRYAIGRLYDNRKAFSVSSKHVLLRSAVNELEQRQNNEPEYSWQWGIQWAIMDRKTGAIVPVSEMLKAGAAVLEKE